MVFNSLRDQSRQAPRAVSGLGLGLPAATAAASATATSPLSPLSRTKRTWRKTTPRRWLIFRRYDDAAAISPIPFGCGQLMLLPPPVNVGGYPPGRYHASRREGWYYRGTIVVLAWYWRATEMGQQERSLIALSVPGAKQQRGHRLTLGSEGGLGAAIFQQGALRLSSGKNFRMVNFGWILSNFAQVPSGRCPRLAVATPRPGRACSPVRSRWFPPFSLPTANCQLLERSVNPANGGAHCLPYCHCQARRRRASPCRLRPEGYLSVAQRGRRGLTYCRLQQGIEFLIFIRQVFCYRPHSRR